MTTVSTEDFPEEWTSNSNEALEISLVDSSLPPKSESFSPQFTYPIFGEAERIYGYKNIKLDLKFDATHLLPLVETSFESKLKKVELDNPTETLLQYLPEDTFQDATQWNKQRQLESATFQIPGKIVSTFQQDNEEYTIHQTTLKDATSRTLLARFQILNLLFIEAGSYIDHTDDRWQIYLLYNGGDKFVGFCTIYPYFYFNDVAMHDAPGGEDNTRNKISQFVILPPYQGKLLGYQLYKTIYEIFMAETTVREISVEDPCEAFDDLRDRCDLERLSKEGVFDSQKNGFGQDIMDKEWMERERIKHKMAQRQFERCVEMALLHYNNPQDAKARQRLRLLIKQRVYARNKDLLSDLTDDERKDKLQETYLRMIEDYQRIIKPVKFTQYESATPRGKKRFGEGLLNIFKRSKS